MNIWIEEKQKKKSNYHWVFIQKISDGILLESNW